MDVKDLKGRPVVAIDGGEKLGDVSDILFNVDDRAIQAFAVGSGGLFKGTSTIVAMADVRSIGPDALMVQGRDALQGDETEHRYRQFPKLKELSSLRVVTESGAHVGSVATVRINAENGTFEDLEIAQSGLAGAFKRHLVVPMAGVVSIGRDVVVIPSTLLGDAGDTAAEAPQPEESTAADQQPG